MANVWYGFQSYQPALMTIKVQSSLAGWCASPAPCPQPNLNFLHRKQFQPHVPFLLVRTFGGLGCSCGYSPNWNEGCHSLTIGKTHSLGGLRPSLTMVTLFFPFHFTRLGGRSKDQLLRAHACRLSSEIKQLL